MFRVADASIGYWLPGIQTVAPLAPIISTKPRVGKEKNPMLKGLLKFKPVVGAVV